MAEFENDKTPDAADQLMLPKIDRRQLLTGLAAAAMTPLAGLSNAFAAAQSPSSPNNVRLLTKRVLRKEDLTYLGAMRVPASGVDMGFSYGPMTGRKVAGEVRLLMVGNLNAGDPIHEFVDTGSYNREPTQAPRMRLLRYWGDVYGSARRTWRPDGSEKTGYPRYPAGMYFNEDTQLLYWTYFDTYNVTKDEDWCMGASRLGTSATAYGPWRPSGGGKKGPWRSVRVSRHPSGALLGGTGLMSGNSGSPWGPDVWTGVFPTENTPAGFNAADLPMTKYLTYYPMMDRINSADGSFKAPVMACRRPGDYAYEAPVAGGTPTNIDPAKNAGIGSWSQLDAISNVEWIDLAEVHGVLCVGRLASGHIWYRNKGVGADRCTHGFASPVDITGPVSTDAYPAFFFFDPADLDAVHAGKKVDYTVDPIAIVNAQTSFGISTATIDQVGSAKSLGGTYFDRQTRKLYVCAPMSDVTIPGVWNPLVHVFQIA
jgi:hypothetical protein